MEVEFLKAAAVKRHLTKLIEEHDEFHWAVAWATGMPLVDSLIARRAKFVNVTIGVAFSQTDPDVVQALIGVPNSYVATRFAHGTYHPKVYGFRSGDRAAAIVGSANFTSGGLGNNHEAALLLTGMASEKLFRDIFEFTDTSARFGEAVTPAWAAAYRESYKRASRMPKLPRDPVPTRTSLPTGSVVSMEWPEFVRQVRKPRDHDIDNSLALLAIARRWFAETSSFADFSAPQRKAVAGILGEYQKTDDDLNRDWGWFGSMKGAGDFANRIDENDRFLAQAVDSIPRTGDVTAHQFERFCTLFSKAFAGSTRTGGVPTASRLLALKRPDTFLCVCQPNIIATSNALGFARSTLNLDNYWERVVEPLRLAPWYNGDKPDGADGDIWEARAALLDVLFYQP